MEQLSTHSEDSLGLFSQAQENDHLSIASNNPLPKTTTDFLLENSEIFENYIESLEKEGREVNNRNVCTLCWCKLTHDQKTKHREDHDAFILTPAKFYEKQSFIQLAISHGRFKEIDGKIFYEPFKERPPKLNQVRKRVKLTQTQTDPKLSQLVSINLKNLPSSHRDEPTKTPLQTKKENSKVPNIKQANFILIRSSSL